MAALRAQVASCLRAPRAPSCERPHNTLLPLRWDDAIVQRILGSDRRMSRSLPPDVRGHLIRHPALPADAERASNPLLPSHDGARSDLALNREPPREFSIAD